MLEVDCICTRLRRSTRALTRRYDEALAPADLNVAQFSLLRHIERLAPVSVSELARASGHERSTLARTLQPLSRQALITLRTGGDRRERVVRLTHPGRARIGMALPYWQRAQREAEACLAGQRATLLELLDRFGANA